MDVNSPLTMLGGLNACQFMRRHWQKGPLLVRQALPGIAPPLARSALFALAGRDDVESRLVVRDGRRWTLRHGPIAFPVVTQLLVEDVVGVYHGARPRMFCATVSDSDRWGMSLTREAKFSTAVAFDTTPPLRELAARAPSHRANQAFSGEPFDFRAERGSVPVDSGYSGDGA